MEFPIVSVDADWVLEQEQLGTKEKYWYRDPSDRDGKDWLFKQPTPGTGGHWAEKVAYEIASAMDVSAPRVELAVLAGKRGSATKSFIAPGVELVHGNQVLKGRDGDMIWIEALASDNTRFRESSRAFRSLILRKRPTSRWPSI